MEEKFERHLKTSEVARILGVNRRTIWRWIKEGKMRVLTPTDGKNVKYIVFGNMKISKDGTEKGWNNVFYL